MNKWSTKKNGTGVWRKKVFIGLEGGGGTYNIAVAYINLCQVDLKILIQKNREMMCKIQQTNSICLSVRRGDFESNAEVKKLQSVCDRKYFEEAIQVIKNNVKNPVFFMFSDDIEWVKNNIYTGCVTYYEDGTDPVWEKLRLMSAC